MWIKKTEGRLINCDNIVDILFSHSSIIFNLTDGTQLRNDYNSREEAQGAYNDLCSLLEIIE